MAAQAASEMIFFIGSVIISAALVGVFFTAVSQVSDSIEQNAAAAASEIGSSVKILNDPAHVAYNNTSLVFTLWVKNTGSQTLSFNRSVIIVDGRTFANDSYNASLAGTLASWSPQAVAIYSIPNLNLTVGVDHWVQVLAPNGAKDLQEFYY